MPDFSARIKRLCAEREVRRRKREGPLTLGQQHTLGQFWLYDLECMREIAADYAEQEKLEAMAGADFANRDPAWGGR